MATLRTKSQENGSIVRLEQIPASNEWHGSASRDRDALARVQKKQVITRKFGFLSMLGFSCTVLITWEGATVLFVQGLQNGGPSGVIYGFILIWLGTLSVFTTISELVSMIPSAAGQYFWCYMLAPSWCRRFLSYLTGWLIVSGWQAFIASGGFLTSTMIQGLIAFTHDSYNPHPWHALLIYWAIIFLAVFINTVLASLLPKLEGLILILHLAGFFAILIPLVTLSPHASAGDVFNTLLNEGGWPTQGLSFMVGLLGNVFAFFGADSAIHMSEEVKDATIVVPRSVIISIIINGVLGFSMLVVMLFCVSDIEAALSTPTGFPFMEIFLQGTESVGGSAAMTSIIILLSFCAAVGIIASASRVLWAFARDRGVPGWNQIRRVHLKGSAPVTAVAVSTLSACLLALIILGSATAFNDVVSLCIAALFSSYLISVVLLLWRRIRGDIKEDDAIVPASQNAGDVASFALTWGPWRIKGWLGTANNALACVYLTVILFFSFWPAYNNPSPSEMNYSVLMLGATVIFSVAYYLLYARKHYRGPLIEV